VSESCQPSESGIRNPVVKRPRRFRRQIGLRTLLLLMAAIAVWMTYHINRRQIQLLESRIRSARPLAHELVVDDPGQYAVVMKDQEWIDDYRWEFYLPAGQYRLCLATHEIDDNGLAPVAKTAPLEAGKHRLVLEIQSESDDHRVVVSLDGTEELAVEEPKEWFPRRGSTHGSQHEYCTQFPTTQPLIFYRSRFRSATTGNPAFSSIPKRPSEGVLLWIERVPGS
jgi:hypothetical protein